MPFWVYMHAAEDTRGYSTNRVKTLPKNTLNVQLLSKSAFSFEILEKHISLAFHPKMTARPHAPRLERGVQKSRRPPGGFWVALSRLYSTVLI
jgi:hypothetical protein